MTAAWRRKHELWWLLGSVIVVAILSCGASSFTASDPRATAFQWSSGNVGAHSSYRENFTIQGTRDGAEYEATIDHLGGTVRQAGKLSMVEYTAFLKGLDQRGVWSLGNVANDMIDHPTWFDVSIHSKWHNHHFRIDDEHSTPKEHKAFVDFIESSIVGKQLEHLASDDTSSNTDVTNNLCAEL